jgi:hypothetical protein
MVGVIDVQLLPPGRIFIGSKVIALNDFCRIETAATYE